MDCAIESYRLVCQTPVLCKMVELIEVCHHPVAPCMKKNHDFQPTTYSNLKIVQNGDMATIADK